MVPRCTFLSHALVYSVSSGRRASGLSSVIQSMSYEYTVYVTTATVLVCLSINYITIIRAIGTMSTAMNATLTNVYVCVVYSIQENLSTMADNER